MSMPTDDGDGLVLDVAQAFVCDDCSLEFRTQRLVPDCPRCGSWSHVCRCLMVVW